MPPAAHADAIPAKAVPPDRRQNARRIPAPPLTLADLEHAHEARLERLRHSRMPMIWQREIAEKLHAEHQARREALLRQSETR